MTDIRRSIWHAGIDFSTAKERTYQEACELISKHWLEKYGKAATAEDIYNYSPSGELMDVHIWYVEALLHYKEIAYRS